MENFEYKKINLKHKTNVELNEKLNELGSQGWEIISYVEDKFNATGKESAVLMKKRTPHTSTPDKQVLND